MTGRVALGRRPTRQRVPTGSICPWTRRAATAWPRTGAERRSRTPGWRSTGRHSCPEGTGTSATSPLPPLIRSDHPAVDRIKWSWLTCCPNFFPPSGVAVPRRSSWATPCGRRTGSQTTGSVVSTPPIWWSCPFFSARAIASSPVSAPVAVVPHVAPERLCSPRPFGTASPPTCSSATPSPNGASARPSSTASRPICEPSPQRTGCCSS